MSTNTEMNVSKIHVEEEYVCCKCETEGWGDENGNLNEDGDFTCEECVEKEECVSIDGDGFVKCGYCGTGGGDHCTEDCPENPENDEPYEVICECCNHALTRDELDERTEKGFNSICFDCEPK